MKKKVILVGGGGHAHSCVELIEQEKKYSIYGIVDLKKPPSKILNNYKYLGRVENLEKLRKVIDHLVIGIGFIKDYQIRYKIFKKIKKLKFKTPNIISPLSLISKNSHLGKGNMIFHNVIVNSNVSIGENCIINNKVLLEHDVRIEDNVHVSTGCIINGSSVIGSNTFIGSGSVISNNIKIGKNCFIKIGSVVTKNIPNNSIF